MNCRRIYWHGTNTKRKANSILKNGFNKDTWFSRHLEDAIEYGGKYVFAVGFIMNEPVKTTRDYNWQFVMGDRIPVSDIFWLKEYTTKETYSNTKLIRDFFAKNNQHIQK